MSKDASKSDLTKALIPARWIIYILAACLGTVFLAGAWANSVNTFMEQGAKKLSGHELLLQDINNRLLRIEIVTGADKVPLKQAVPGGQ